VAGGLEEFKSDFWVSIAQRVGPKKV
jgi:hypothetical protein